MLLQWQLTQLVLINALNADYNDVFIDMQESQTLEESPLFLRTRFVKIDFDRFYG